MLKFVGAVLAAVGGIHKALKFFGPVDRRQDYREASAILDAAVTKELEDSER